MVEHAPVQVLQCMKPAFNDPDRLAAAHYCILAYANASSRGVPPEWHVTASEWVGLKVTLTATRGWYPTEPFQGRDLYLSWLDHFDQP
jgi:hypothetical protein